MHIGHLAETFLFMLCPNEPDCNVYIDKCLCISSPLVVYFVVFLLSYCIRRPYIVHFSGFEYWSPKVFYYFCLNFLENMDIEVSQQLWFED